MKGIFFEEHWRNKNGVVTGGVSSGRGVAISWQNGALGQGADRTEPNGAFVETVLSICAGRLAAYQGSSFRCKENEVALEAIYKALDALDSRTYRREKQDVEGTHKGN